jgi:multifunctional methyltransferase subunit TRM112
MKILTLNFLTCARKLCKSNPLSFPLHPKDATLEYVPTSEMTSESSAAKTVTENTEGASEETEVQSEEEQREELELQEAQVQFLQNIVPRLEFPALRGLCEELGLKFPWDGEFAPESELLWEPPANEPTGETHDESMDVDEENEKPQETENLPRKPSQLAKDFHRILLETVITEGKLVCGACEHEYAVKEGIANFLLPGHLV